MATASVQLRPPDNFDFSKPDTWTRWKKRFEQFRAASGLKGQAEERQVNTLLYCIGDEADTVLTSTNIKDDDRKKYDAVLSKLDSFFQVRKNVIFERAKFNRRNQLDGESVERYITVLYALVETCEYGALQDEMLRDRIVVGIRDKALSERMQAEASLTLEKAKTMARQKEAIAEQSSQLRGDGSKQSPIAVDQVRGGQPHPTRRGNAIDIGRSNNKPRGGPAGNPQCTRCGKPKHPRGDRCPARDATCHKCNRKGHFQSQCFSKTVAATSNELSLDSAFVGNVSTSQPVSWNTTIFMKEREVNFKLDTGAEVTAISNTLYRSLGGINLGNPQKSSTAQVGRPSEF